MDGLEPTSVALLIPNSSWNMGAGNRSTDPAKQRYRSTGHANLGLHAEQGRNRHARDILQDDEDTRRHEKNNQGLPPAISVRRSARLTAPSLVKLWLTWWRTVNGLSLRCFAIWLFRMPLATRARTSRSRLVRSRPTTGVSAEVADSINRDGACRERVERTSRASRITWARSSFDVSIVAKAIAAERNSIFSKLSA